MKSPDVILITGASSGIGSALALAYARKGVKLLLMGRNTERLTGIERQCRAQGAAVKTAAIDITDRTAVEKQVGAWDDQEAIDLVIANAGVSGTDDAYAEILNTNINGVFHVVEPLLPRMRARGKGQIALMSSIAGLRGLPNAPAYSTSKVAVRAYGEALRPLMAESGVRVSTIFPGFIRTPLTDKNSFSMPFMMDAAKAALAIKQGLEKGKRRIGFPWQMYGLMRLFSALPAPVSDFIFMRGPRKK